MSPLVMRPLVARMTSQGSIWIIPTTPLSDPATTLLETCPVVLAVNAHFPSYHTVSPPIKRKGIYRFIFCFPSFQDQTVLPHSCGSVFFSHDVERRNRVHFRTMHFLLPFWKLTRNKTSSKYMWPLCVCVCVGVRVQRVSVCMCANPGVFTFSICVYPCTYTEYRLYIYKYTNVILRKWWFKEYSCSPMFASCVLSSSVSSSVSSWFQCQ